MIEKSKKPATTVLLTDQEARELDKISWYAHCDPDKGENSYADYQSKLTAWSAKVRERNKLDDKEPFFSVKKKVTTEEALAQYDKIKQQSQRNNEQVV